MKPDSDIRLELRRLILEREQIASNLNAKLQAIDQQIAELVGVIPQNKAKKGNKISSKDMRIACGV